MDTNLSLNWNSQPPPSAFSQMQSHQPTTFGAFPQQSHQQRPNYQPFGQAPPPLTTNGMMMMLPPGQMQGFGQPQRQFQPPSSTMYGRPMAAAAAPPMMINPTPLRPPSAAPAAAPLSKSDIDDLLG